MGLGAPTRDATNFAVEWNSKQTGAARGSRSASHVSGPPAPPATDRSQIHRPVRSNACAACRVHASGTEKENANRRFDH